MVNFYLPSKEHCDAIVEASDSFIKKEMIWNGFETVQYNYRVPKYSDFHEFKAWELRGLTFVYDGKGNWTRHLMLHKFFNVYETPENQYHILKNKGIQRVQEKLDGSMIRFVRFPDGNWFAKTKFAFESDQASAANKILDNDPELLDFLEYCESNDCSPIFEYVSPDNKVVIQYYDDKLELLQIRDNKTGEYKRFRSQCNYYSEAYQFAALQDYRTFNDYLKKADDDEVEEFEGWVITFDDGHMAKLKTNWYVLNHRLIEDFSRIDYIIENTVNETIDDILAKIKDDEFQAHVEYKRDKFLTWFNNKVSNISFLTSQYTGDRKAFAIQFREREDFSVIMNALDNGAQSAVKRYVLKRIRTLSGANLLYEEMK